ncbi:hypothetical protein Acsp02_27510 [Actinoplanes sp. NBRC 103695]|nr:hypothetical protein Acsp02_27510 [Actinoplanes sp. NBRC 103695]
MLPVLDRDVEIVPAGVEIRDHRFARPISVTIDDIAPVTVLEKLRIEVFTGGPLTEPRANANLGGLIRHKRSG